MNVIFVGRKSGRVKQFDLRHPVIMSAAVLIVLAIVGTAFSVGVGLGARHGSGNPIDQLGNWSAELLHQKARSRIRSASCKRKSTPWRCVSDK